MKRIILSILVIASLAGHSQIEERETADWKLIGRLKFGGITKAKMQFISSGTDTTYLLFIKDVREQPKNNYFNITFKNTDGTYNKLYSILKSFFLRRIRKTKNTPGLLI